MRNCKWCRVRLSSVLSSRYWSLRSLYNFISNAELLRKHTSAFHRILSWHQEMMKRDQEKHKMYFPSLCLENFYFYGLGCLHPRRPRGQIVEARESLKVARYSFSRPIPPKFEHKIRFHKQSFGKIATTVVLDKMKICYDHGCNGIGVVIATKWRNYLFYLQNYFSALATVLPKSFRGVFSSNSRLNVREV